MVNVIIDYKKNAIKSPCKICNRLILKGQMRVKIASANDSYFRDYSFFHLDCLINRLNSFKEVIPVNELKI